MMIAAKFVWALILVNLCMLGSSLCSLQLEMALHLCCLCSFKRYLFVDRPYECFPANI